ncbi:MAG: 30S ribosomal protein S21 [Hyphomicrobiales bacterium]
MRIIVRDNNVEQALRIMKKKMQREGVFRQLKQGASFEKPSEKRIRERAEAIRRARKAQRKKLQREGLLPMPKLKPRPPRPGQSRAPFNIDGPQASAVQAAPVKLS